MLKQQVFLALLVLFHSSIIPSQDQSPSPSLPIPSADLSAPTSTSTATSIQALQAIQQHLLDTYTSADSSTPSGTVNSQGLNSSSLAAIKQDHGELMNQYFKNNRSINIDNGNNNSISGVRNIIQSGDQNKINGLENVLQGNSNRINGDNNIINGNSNHIDSKNNFVYGSGNIIMDGTSGSTSSQTPTKPAPPTPTNHTASNYPTAGPTYSQASSETSITNSQTNKQVNLSNQFDHYLFLGCLFVALQLLLL